MNDELFTNEDWALLSNYADEQFAEKVEEYDWNPYQEIDCGDAYSIEEFVSLVDDGSFIPDDGFGEVVDKNGNIYDYNIWGEEIKSLDRNKYFVMWYNK